VKTVASMVESLSLKALTNSFRFRGLSRQSERVTEVGKERCEALT